MRIINKIQESKVGMILALGVLAISTAAIFIRLCFEIAGVQGVGFSLFLAASRLIIAATILLPRWPNLKYTQENRSATYYACGAGCCLALHFATWITSLSFTSIATSTTLVTTTPVWISLLSWWWFGEKLTKPMIRGITIALVGGILITLGDGSIGGENNNPLLGDFLALIGAWMASLYLLLGREAQRFGFSVGNYILIAYSSAALLLLPFPLLMGTSYLGYPKEVYLYVLLMAIFSQLIGHTTLNWAVRSISPTLVALAILFEPVGSSVFGWIIFGELPPQLVILGGVVVLIGVAIAIIAKTENRE
ncbi:DMT family transporter [Gloeothece verrucosa]|uniref:EamA domain-containing protein n=1 Tax=Gloeothece verrucosa (strain PCC 7822) TaxID=497965 RepID=E0UFF6_GLOV7|nr:DMT family transporter [Gloeothece verrucosa]ADN16650.1 protein of unknown function DUF6 transmembrane [Gloeothece verrucosa PCC 7822]